MPFFNPCWPIDMTDARDKLWPKHAEFSPSVKEAKGSRN